MYLERVWIMVASAGMFMCFWVKRESRLRVVAAEVCRAGMVMVRVPCSSVTV